MRRKKKHEFEDKRSDLFMFMQKRCIAYSLDRNDDFDRQEILSNSGIP